MPRASQPQTLSLERNRGTNILTEDKQDPHLGKRTDGKHQSPTQGLVVCERNKGERQKRRRARESTSVPPLRGAAPPPTITTHHNEKGPFFSCSAAGKQTGVVKRKTAHILIPKSPTLSHRPHFPHRDPWKAGAQEAETLTEAWKAGPALPGSLVGQQVQLRARV